MHYLKALNYYTAINSYVYAPNANIQYSAYTVVIETNTGTLYYIIHHLFIEDEV